MLERFFDRGLDPVLMLSLTGAIGIYSASEPGSIEIFFRQLIWIGLGLAVCVLVARMDYRFLTEHALISYGAALGLLVLVLFYGVEVNGSLSWLVLGPFRFQPSELGKIGVVLILTRFLSRLDEPFLGNWDLVKVSLLTVAPMSLITLQGDLGTALMYVPILIGVVLVAGLRFRVLICLLVLAVSAAPAGWIFLKDYQKQRILSTLDPDLDPQGIGYQTRQSQIAIGSGGVFGRGIGQGNQSHLGFVPEIHSDFIFALLAEETGLVGAVLILLLYLLVLMRLTRIGDRARDKSAILLIAGIVSMFSSHILVNVGMTLGIFPPIGIPLPLLSYGGSFTIVTFAALGLALSAQSQRYAN